MAELSGTEVQAAEFKGFIIAQHCVSSLSLYDSNENEIGGADNQASEGSEDEDFLATFRNAESVTTSSNLTLDQALEFLRSRMPPGGSIDAHATFRIEPQKENNDSGEMAERPIVE